MRVLSSNYRVRARSALAGGVFAAFSVLAVSPVLSASAEPPAAVASKLLGANLSTLWSDPAARKPVIVQFKTPDFAAPAGIDSPEAVDAAQTRAVHAAQDAILGAAFGSSALAGPAADDLKVKRMDFSPMFGITVTAAQLEKLAANPDVIRIQEDELAKPLLDQAVPLVGMTNAYAQGATGAGWAVAILDSGSRRPHEFLGSKVVSAACYSTTSSFAGSPSTPPYESSSYCPGGVGSSTSIDSANDCDPGVIEGCGHGTHVAGIAAGNNTNRQSGEPANGVSRNGTLIPINVFSRFTSTGLCGASDCILSFTSDQIKGLERVFALRNTFNIAAINMSLGGGQNFSACDGDSRKPIIDQLKTAGIATLIAAGNDGFDSSVSAPGCISSAVTVASTTKADVRSSFSNWGNLIDIVAPGSQIFSSYVSGSSNTSYATLSGTSMATPMAAGAFAAIRSARPNATVDQIENALKSTGLGITSAGVTKPRIRVDQALAVTPGGNPAAIVAAVTPVARATAVNGTVTAFATILNTGGATATSCGIGLPNGQTGITFTYSARNVTTGAPENPNVPVNIPAGGGRNFVISFKPTVALSANLALRFGCSNTALAPSVLGLNTFLLTAVNGTPPADLVSVAVTPSNDGIMNVPLSGVGLASLAAQNIGSAANLVARLDVNAIGGSGGSLNGNAFMCQTDPSTGVCISAQGTQVSFSLGANQTATFSAFLTSNGQPIPFDPANKRLYVHFLQGTSAVGSASVAVRTTGSAAPAVAAAEKTASAQ